MSFFGFKGTLIEKVAFQFLVEGFSFLTPTARIPPPMSQDPPLGPTEWAQGRGGAGLPSHPTSAVSCPGNCAVEAELGPQAPIPRQVSPSTFSQ